MYKAMFLSNTAVSAQYASNGLDLTIPLITQFAGPPPAGTLVRGYNGMLYVVSGDTVYFSDPYGLELFRLDTNFLRFPGRIVMFESVNDGVYVGTADIGGEDAESVGATWFLSGDRPDRMKSTQLFDYGVVETTAVKTDAAYFETPAPGQPQEEPARPAIIWLSRHGIILGKDGGSVQNLTEDKYSLPIASRGAVILRQSRGFAQFIVSLQAPGDAYNAYLEPQ